ncbi:metal ABC transporter permease [Thermoleophilia bacterium SCSIO 60948]|nr:metal ABC transporter permease [Thermoleophilia bacterium SCSIO 60948]
MDWLTDPFSAALTQRALVEVVLLGIACGPLGVWVVLHRYSYAAESIAHGMLPGLVLAALLGIPLGLGGVAGLALAALAIASARRLSGISTDGAVAVTVTFLFGLGGLLALSPAAPLRLGEILFGDPLSVTSQDLIATGALVALIALGLAGSARGLAIAGFDPAAARSLGAPPGRIELALLGLLAATTLVAVTALGNLLVVALIVAPAAAALRLSRRLGGAVAISTALAILSGVAGLYASFYLDVAAGAAIALSAIVIYVLAALADGLVLSATTQIRRARPPGPAGPG